MPERDVNRSSSDQRISSARILEMRKESVDQRDRAKRQRRSAKSMREEAREIRQRTSRDLPRLP